MKLDALNAVFYVLVTKIIKMKLSVRSLMMKYPTVLDVCLMNPHAFTPLIYMPSVCLTEQHCFNILF